MIADRFERDELAEMFDYLDALRASGITNMFGASPYVAKQCGLNGRDAKTVLAAWMASFNRDEPANVRAERVWQTSYDARADFRHHHHERGR